MPKAIVTGGTGFVGLHLVHALVADGFDVTVFIRASSDETVFGNVLPKITVRRIDLSRREELFAAFADTGPAHLFHLATSTLMSGKTADPQTLLSTNVIGTVNVMDAALEGGALSCINMGSFAEYGPKDHPVKEDERCDPVELYAVSKLAATLYGQGLARRNTFPCITFRLFTPYGPGIQKGRLLRTMIEKIKAGEPVPLATPTISRDFVFVLDIPPLLIDAARHASEQAGRIYNLGSGTRTSLQELITLVEQQLGVKAQPEWNAFPIQSYDSELWQADMSQTFSAFNWRPTTSLVDGVKQVIASLQ